MPFQIVRNDIANMHVDAIVNTTNPTAEIGYGVDSAIHLKAGPQLLEARKALGLISVGNAALTPAFQLDAKYVIHTVCPVWQGGNYGEEQLLANCYSSALQLALEHHCESIAFPLMSAGNHGFPKPAALQIAMNTISRFLMMHDMMIYLVVFSRDAFALSEKLFRSVESYIDENYIYHQTLKEYELADKCNVREAQISETLQMQRRRRRAARMEECLAPAPQAAPFASMGDLEALLNHTDAGFSETLLKLIDRSGKKDSEIYKKANIDRKLFSKIKNNPNYNPKKPTVLAFAIALELNLSDTEMLLSRAGYALSHASKFDIIIEYFIKQKNYDIFELNEVLFAFDQPLLGSD